MFQKIKHMHIFLVLFALYAALVLSAIEWGIPGERGAFLYHMDEWHQLMSVRSLVREGTPNVVGAANGPILQFLLAGVWLAPAILSGSLDLDAITTPITGLDVQHDLFLLLRFNTFFFGVATLVVLSIFIVRFCKSNLSVLIFFVGAPVWVLLSNYFKYDIALIFWIALSLLGILWFGEKPSLYRYLLSGIPVTAALATKISAAPILLLYIVAYFIFVPSWKKEFSWLSYGLSCVLLLFCILGIPDLIFLAKGEYLEFLYDNIISVPQRTFNFVLPYNYWVYLIWNQLPYQFGYGLIGALLGTLLVLIKRGRLLHERIEPVDKILFLGFTLFLVSLLPLKLYMLGNRWLVLLPFMVLLLARMVRFAELSFKKSRTKALYWLFIGICGGVQIIQVTSWMSVKWSVDPRVTASAWIENTIPQNSRIGIEAIPLYQMIPDQSLDEYYSVQYLPDYVPYYSYEIIDAKTQQLPEFIVVSNTQSTDFELTSTKKDLLVHIDENGYFPVAQFTPNTSLLNYFGTTRDFYFSGLPAIPVDITIYSRE